VPDVHWAVIEWRLLRLHDNADRPQAPDVGSLVQQTFKNLTVAETKLISAASRGEIAMCGVSDVASDPTNDPKNADQWGIERHIRAELIAWLCLDGHASSLIHPKGIQVLGAIVRDALDLSFITVGFPLALARCRLRNGLILQGAHTRTISLEGSWVHSIFADGAVISGALFLRGGFHADHGVQLTGASVCGPLDCSGSIFENTGSSAALVADAIVVTGPAYLRAGFRSTGEVRFHHARIGSDLDCTQGRFKVTTQAKTKQTSPALDGEGIVVGGSVFLRHGFHSEGLVLLHGAQIAFNLDCTGGRFENPARQDVLGTGTALNIDASAVQGTVLLSDGFQADGRVTVTNSQINGDLRCAGANFGSGVIAERTVVKSALFWRDIRNPTTVSLNLINTSVDSLSDDTASWPSRGNLQLHGFRYRQISAFSPRNAKERLAWLARLKSFTPQPYKQLANVLKEEDDDVGARRVLYRMASLRNQEDRGKLTRAWSFILKYAIGYGYYPVRALFWLFGLTAFGYLLFLHGYYAGHMVPTDKDAYASFKYNRCPPDYYEKFHASIYSLENSLPIVKFGQVERWQPDPSAKALGHTTTVSSLEWLAQSTASAGTLRAFRWVQIVLGWFFTTMGIAGVTGLVRED